MQLEPSLMSSLSITLLCVVVPALLYYLHHRRKFQLIAKIPGYKDWPLVGDVLHLKRNPLDFYEQVLALFEENRVKGYKIAKFKIAHWALVGLSGPEGVEKLLSSNKLINKSSDYDILHKWLGLGLLTSTGDKWRSRRKMLTPSFHFNILQDFLATMNEHCLTLKEKLHEAAVTNKPVDMFPYITLNSLDIICDTAMGVKMDALHNSESDYVKAVFLVKDSMAIRQRSPWLWSDTIYYRLPQGKKVEAAIETMHQFAYTVIKERSEHREGEMEVRKHKAFLDMLLDCTDEGGNPLTINDIREEVDTFMFEGHDTVSAATSYAVYLIGLYPEIQKRCVDELHEIFDTPRDITMDDLRRMPYLEACIKETLRIFPSVPWYARELTEDTEFEGFLVPKGTTATVFTSVLHRDPEIYPDPEKFDPERFLGDAAKSRHPYAYVPFSAGPRNCIGQRFAMMELKAVLATVLRNFTIQSLQKREEIRPNPGIVLQPEQGIWVKLIEHA